MGGFEHIHSHLGKMGNVPGANTYDVKGVRAIATVAFLVFCLGTIS